MNLTIRKWRIDDKSNLAVNLNNLRVLNNLRDGLPYPYTENDAEDFIRAMSRYTTAIAYSIKNREKDSP